MEGNLPFLFAAVYIQVNKSALYLFHFLRQDAEETALLDGIYYFSYIYCSKISKRYLW